MNILEIIRKKRDKENLSKEEIEFFINEYTNGRIQDYQASALIMAIYLNGMNKEETANLAMAMGDSGEILDLSNLGETIVEKHSTGGVGDKVSLILLPIVASLGVKVAKTSGRGLGFTGGTIDKLESIPGFRTEISDKEFIKHVKDIGISIVAQTKNLAPADKKIYAIRDTISCVDNIPLIASSVMSKKIACGADKIILEVAVGSGALMKDIESARKLAKEMIDIGNLAKRQTVAILTNMDEPLGYAIGNNLEVKEAVEFLKGSMPEDLKELILNLGSYMIMLSGKNNDIEENKKNMLENIKNGNAYKKFIELVENQGGDISYIEDTNKFKKSKYIEPIFSKKEGYLKSVKTEKIGEVANYLGAGRLEKDDKIDYSVGIVMNKKIGDFIKKGDILLYIHANDKEKLEGAKKELENCFEYTKDACDELKIILEVIS